MSFDDLKETSCIKKSNTFTVKHGEKELTFTAKELSRYQRVEIAGERNSGNDWIAKFVAASIVDADGKRMTINQAESLPDTIADVFLQESFKVNALENIESEENKKKTDSN